MVSDGFVRFSSALVRIFSKNACRKSKVFFFQFSAFFQFFKKRCFKHFCKIFSKNIFEKTFDFLQTKKNCLRCLRKHLCNIYLFISKMCRFPPRVWQHSVDSARAIRSSQASTFSSLHFVKFLLPDTGADFRVIHQLAAYRRFRFPL